MYVTLRPAAKKWAVLLIIFYFLYQQRSIGFESAIHTAWQGSAHRLVIFGDDWSDTGTYRALPAPQDVAVRDPARGKIWAETLCDELACDLIDNFACSVPMNADDSTVGSLIHSVVHSATTTGNGYNSSVGDLKTQVEQFLEYEKQKYRIPKSLRPSDDWTVFAVLFGLWDLLEYSKLEAEYAMRAIDRSIAELFGQLDVLASQASMPLHVVIPQMIDITFLPRFRPAGERASAEFAQMQHQRLFLQTYWNAVLFQTAALWQGGKVFMPESNAVVIDHVRMKQLQSEGILDASSTGEHQPLFEDVEQPCVTIYSGDNAPNLQAAAVEKCSDPTAHLFWDDLHLGPSVHELIGKQAARLVRGNHTVNSLGTTNGVPDHENTSGHMGGRFTLKFPPNY
ncbi:slightly ste11-like protein [Pleosporales sp. CAS-2024a]